MTTTEARSESVPRGMSNPILVKLLIVVGCVAVMGGAMALWLRATALDTDTFVETVTPLPQDPEIATALATIVVDNVFADIDVEAEVRQSLPQALGFLAAPVAAAVEDLAVDIAEEIITSDAFVGLWSTATRLAHAQAVAVLTGREAVVIGPGGSVTLGLGETAAGVREALESAGLGELLPAPRQDEALVVLFNDGQVGVLQVTVDLLDLTYFALPLLALAALGSALWLSRDRRRTLFSASVGVGISSAVGLLVVDLARGRVLGKVENDELLPAVTETWDILFRNLVETYVGLMALAALVAGVAWVTGSHPRAMATRGAVSARLARPRPGTEPGPEGDDQGIAFLVQHGAALGLLGTAGILAILFLWPRLTTTAALVGGAILLAYLGVIRFLASNRGAARDSSDA